MHQMTRADRLRICLEQTAKQEFADCMLGIVIAVDHFEQLMARLGVGNTSCRNTPSAIHNQNQGE